MNLAMLLEPFSEARVREMAESVKREWGSSENFREFVRAANLVAALEATVVEQEARIEVQDRAIRALLGSESCSVN